MDERLAHDAPASAIDRDLSPVGAESDKTHHLTTLFVCTRCSLPGSDRGQEPRDGERFLDAVHNAASTATGPGDRLLIRGVACLSNCNRPCTVAFVGPRKMAYVYGELGTDPDDPAAVVAMAALYAASSNGVMVWRERPERFRRGLIARVPPFDFNGEPVLAHSEAAV